MSASMAEVVAQHRIVWESDGDYGEKQWVACSCTHLSFEDDYWTGETQSDHETHVAEHLAANGYGNVREARAQALTDAADDFESNIGVAEFDDLAERNGSRWTHIADAWEHQGPYMDWLRNRAATEKE